MISQEFLITITDITDLFISDPKCDSITISINMNYYGINTLYSCIDFILASPVFIMELLSSSNTSLIEITQSNVSNDFTYNRFLESIKRTVDKIVDYNISIKNRDTGYTPRIGQGHAGNMKVSNLDSGYLTNMAYLLFIFSKAHLAHYIGLIMMLLSYLFSNIFSIFLNSNKFYLYLFLVILQAKFVGATKIVLSNKIISGLVWFFYINAMAVYDTLYKTIQSRHIYQTLITDGRINFKFLRQRLYLGGLFLIVINAGVLFSSSFAYVTIPLLNMRTRVIATISSYVISTLASTGWLYTTRREVLGYTLYSLSLSYIRAFFESVAFNALSYANFIVWSILPQTFTTYLTTFLIGLLCYFIASFFQIMLETDLNHIVLYGFIYNFVFTSLSISSSGLYFLMNVPNMLLPIRLTLMILCGIIIILLPLEVYRFPPRVVLRNMGNNRTLLGYLIGRERAASPLARNLVSMLYQLILFFAFAIGTFIWLDATGLGG